MQTREGHCYQRCSIMEVFVYKHSFRSLRSFSLHELCLRGNTTQKQTDLTTRIPYIYIDKSRLNIVGSREKPVTHGTILQDLYHGVDPSTQENFSKLFKFVTAHLPVSQQVTAIEYSESNKNEISSRGSQSKT